MKKFVVALFVFLFLVQPYRMNAEIHLNDSVRYWYGEVTPLPDGWFEAGQDLKILSFNGDTIKVSGVGIDFSGKKSRVTAFILREKIWQPLP